MRRAVRGMKDRFGTSSSNLRLRTIAGMAFASVQALQEDVEVSSAIASRTSTTTATDPGSRRPLTPGAPDNARRQKRNGASGRKCWAARESLNRCKPRRTMVFAPVCTEALLAQVSLLLIVLDAVAQPSAPNVSANFGFPGPNASPR